MKVSKLIARRTELQNEIGSLQNEINQLVSIERNFFSEETPVLHRRHGWLNDDERQRIVRYFSAGISSVEIAEKFACSTPTVYNCMRRVLRETTAANPANPLG